MTWYDTALRKTLERTAPWVGIHPKTGMVYVRDVDILRRAGLETGDIEPLTPAQLAPLAGAAEIPRDASKGDLALPCFALAKQLKVHPLNLAAAVAGAATGACVLEPPLRAVSHAGPFVNFEVDGVALAREVLPAVLGGGDSFGNSGVGAGKTIVLDLSSPNIAKPFGVGHLRSTVIGQALHRIHSALGYRCVGINYLGDWGTQFGFVLWAFRQWGSEAELQARPLEHLYDLYTRANAEAKTNAAIAVEARGWFRRLEQGDAEARTLWERFRKVSLAYLEGIYRLLDVAFEVTASESEYNGKMAPVVAALEAKGLTRVSEGALIVDLSAHGIDTPCLLRKGDEGSLYATRDLAAFDDRFRTYGFEKALYVVGADQKLHFRQLFKVLELWGHPGAGKAVHVDFGLVRFKGEKMSTRGGHVVLLEGLLQKAVEIARGILKDRELPEADKEDLARAVGIGAVVFNDLKHRRVKDVDFDWDQVLAYDPETKAFKGETGPYLQYTIVRMVGIRKKAPDDLRAAAAGAALPAERLTDPEEQGLVKTLARFGDTLSSAASQYEPSVLAGYLLDLAAKFNAYYHDRTRHQVVSDDRDLTVARLALCRAVETILRRGLTLLGVRPVEAM